MEGMVAISPRYISCSAFLSYPHRTGPISSLAEYVERGKDRQDLGKATLIALTAECMERRRRRQQASQTRHPDLHPEAHPTYSPSSLPPLRPPPAQQQVDEYAISALPELEGKRFQNVAKEGVTIDTDSKAANLDLGWGDVPARSQAITGASPQLSGTPRSRWR